MSIIARLTFSIGWFLHYARLKQPSLFPPKIHGRENGLRIITGNNACTCASMLLFTDVTAFADAIYFLNVSK